MQRDVGIQKKDGSKLKIGIARARWNADIIDSLTEGCMRALRESGVSDERIKIIEVPGSFELPSAAKMLIDSDQVDAVVCLGCLIKGETMHFEYISSAVADGIMRLGLASGVPVIFGVLTCLTAEQARVRSIGDNNHGYFWGMTAVEMGILRQGMAVNK